MGEKSIGEKTWVKKNMGENFAKNMGEKAWVKKKHG